MKNVLDTHIFFFLIKADVGRKVSVLKRQSDILEIRSFLQMLSVIFRES